MRSLSLASRPEGLLISRSNQEHIRKSRNAAKAFEELTQKRTAQSLAKKTTTADMLQILRAEKQEAEVRPSLIACGSVLLTARPVAQDGDASLPEDL